MSTEETATPVIKNFFDITNSNKRGIPKAPFVENVEDFVGSHDQVEMVLAKFQDMISKYKYMEINTTQRAESLKEKIPDIKKSLDMVQFINSKKDSKETFTCNYELNETLFAKAQITPTNIVYLWLGANVMLEYTTSDAIDLLKQRLADAKDSLATCEEDLEFLRENITTMEVNTARVYNWDVQIRRAEKPID